MATPQMATLVNPTTSERKAVQVGSQDAQQLFGQGFVLETKPGAAPSTPSPAPGTPSITPPTSTGPTPTTAPLANTEAKPGTFDANKLSTFFSGQIESFRPKFEAAASSLSDVNAAIAGLKAPDYSALYGEEYQTKVAPLDIQISEVGTKVNQIDDSVRKIEDDLRASLGGQAPESIIKAEAARRAQPLLLQRQSLVDQFNTLSGSRENALSALQTGIGLRQDTFRDSFSILQEKARTAQSVVDQFNTLVEKGAQASNDEIDNFRQTFTTLLTQAPDVLRNLTEEEVTSIEQGFIPRSVMQKIGETINEAKLKESNVSPAQILTRASQIQSNASAMGQTITTDQAIAQAQAEFAALEGRAFDGGSGGGMGTFDGGTSDVMRIAETIKQIESGGNYNAKGASGESGAYQFMPATWKSWAGQYLGNANAPQTPENQDKVAVSRITDLVNQGYSPREIALIWNGGQPIVKKGVNAKGVKYDSGSYADKFMAAYTGSVPANTVVTPSTAPSVVEERGQSFDQFIASKEKEAGQSFSPARRESLRAEYESSRPSPTLMAAADVDGQPFVPRSPQPSTKFTPQFYSTTLGQKTLDNEMTARQRFETNQIVKDFSTVQDQVMSMKSILDGGVGGPQDLAVVYTFMKALDPTSVVREAEYDAAAKSGNIFKGVMAKFNGYMNEEGGFLPDNVKQAFLKIVTDRLKAKTAQYNNYAKQTRAIAERQGLNPDNVAIQFDFTSLPESSGGPVANVSRETITPSARPSASNSNPLSIRL